MTGRFAIRLAMVRGALAVDRAATGLAIAGIALGVATFGSFAGAERLVRGDLDAQFRANRPADLVLTVDRPLDEDVLAAVRSLPEVEAVDPRRTYRFTLGVDPSRELDIVAVEDLEDQQLGEILRAPGTAGPRRGSLEVLVDRTALEPLGVDVGDRLEVVTTDGRRAELTIVGSSQEPGRAAWFEERPFGLSTLAALAPLGEAAGTDQLAVRLTDAARAADKGRVGFGPGAGTSAIIDELRSVGVGVRDLRRNEAGQAASDRTLETAFLVLQALGMMSLVSSGFLVATVIDAIVTRRRRELGVVRAIGGSRAQVAGLVVLLVGAYALAGTIVGVVTSLATAWLLASYVAGLVNVDLVSAVAPPGTLVAVAATGLSAPLAFAISGAASAGRGAVRTTIEEHGLAGGTSRALMRPLACFARTVGLRLAVANAVRRRTRVAMTVGSLAVGGAIVLSVVGTRASLARSIDEDLGLQTWDVLVAARSGAPVDEVARVVATVDGVLASERWLFRGAAAAMPPLPFAPGSAPSRRPADRLVVPTLGVPADSTMLHPVLLAGRLLDPTDHGAIVVNGRLAEMLGLSVGQTIELTLGTATREWDVVGVVAQPLDEPLAIVTEAAARAAGPLDPAHERVALAVRGDDHRLDSELAVAIESRLDREGVEAELDTATARRAAHAADVQGFEILGRIMVAVASLVIVIGGLGLVATMAAAVAERRREIGVLRAIGADAGWVVRLLLVEAGAAAAFGALLAAILAVPFGTALGSVLGQAFADRPLGYEIVPGTIVGLAVAAVLLAALASVGPGRQAARLVVRDALAYE